METNNRIIVGILLVVALLILIVSLTTVGAVETCPDGDGWTKIDSDDLSAYPVEGATQYCFKYGSPNSQGCEGGISDVWPPDTQEKYCGLSHWSYYIPPIPTPTPEETPTQTPTPNATPTPTPTEKPEITPTHTPTPSQSLSPTPTHSPTPTPEPEEVTEEAEEAYQELIEEKPYLLELGVK